MNKEQKIEEMAQLFCEYFKNGICKVKLKECDIDCGFAMTAEKIYTAGYRKIDDDCAVITKAELKQYKLQAVKEFAEKLKEKFNGYEATYYDGYEEGFHDLQEEIYELLKEYEE